MNREEFIQLADKVSKGLASDKELAKYNQWYRSFQKDIEWKEEWGDKSLIEGEILNRINKEISPVKKTTFHLRRMAVASILLMIFGSALVFYFAQPVKNSNQELVIKNDINPGGNKAILTLDDGSTISLDDSEEGVLAVEGSASISKTGQGILSYHFDKEQPGQMHREKFNTISTPQGGQFKVLLPDGSSVWLNALSSVRFPVDFNGASRNVEITGEVYFEVVHDQSRPFFVKTGNQVVKVLGTQFNINAYENESGIATTLTEGSVEISNGGQSVIISPGQQAVNTPEAEIEVSEVDIDPVIAWKDGVFQFWSTDIKDIMRQLSRWYQVEVEYLNDFGDEVFTGFISRDVNISRVLEMLEEAGDVKFGIEGNTVRVKVISEN
ncbi:FecR family protein [Membranihabitans maritimus]|uniref:FecR family protein n=1 Tax=Membranihabitans maritimus TaxID=2904244 RepID=UPI001F1F165D|nr:FecR family protein [Membranihabitans maritimus]